MPGQHSLRRRFLSLSCLLTLLLLAGVWNLPPSPARRRVPDNAASSAGLRKSTAEQAALLGEAYGKLPLSFEANDGQTDARVKFLSRGSGYTLFLTPTETVLRLRVADRGLRAWAS